MMNANTSPTFFLLLSKLQYVCYLVIYNAFQSLNIIRTDRSDRLKEKSSTYTVCQHEQLAESDMEIYSTTFCLPHTMTERFANIQSLAIIDSKKKCTS